MLYPQYVIDDLKVRADLVRLIQPYAPDLKKKGANWMACCPFHQEKTPSFSVNPAKGFYKCFGCGKGGTAFNFVMEIEGLNFPEAIKRVAEASGYILPEPVDDQAYAASKKKRDEKKQLADQIIELNQVALDFWESELQKKNKDAKAAREYLASRGISDEVQKRFRIGYSPDKWDALIGVLRDFGADEQLIARSGLVSVNEEKERTYDRFRGRIMFPVLDIDGRPVAFGARALKPDDNPKYLNSPETPAYIKGENLYGLYQAKDEIRKKKFAILVEGYLDLIALAQYDVPNVAASLGTAFTPEQAKLLGRFAKRVVINYDGDDAGIKAARRAIEHLLPQDFDVKVLVLPDGKDPDDFIRENGTDAYNKARGNAATYLRFSLDSAVKGRNIHNAKQKAAAIEEFLPVVAAIRNNVERRETFDQAMTFFHVEDGGLRRELWNALPTAGASVPASVAQRVVRVARPKITESEQLLLKLLVHDPELRNVIIPQLEETDFRDLATAEVFERFVSLHSKQVPITAETLAEEFAEDEDAADIAHQIFVTKAQRNAEDPLETVLHKAEECVLALRGMAITRRIEDVRREAAAAEAAGDTIAVQELIHEQLDLEKIRRELVRQAASV
jgi:DNA primase